MLGNGLRAQIWKELKARTDIPSIVELYAATEGNIGLVNLEGRVGAVGYTPVTFPEISPMRIFKVDTDSGELLRGSDGLCIPCKPGETGQVAGWINPRESHLIRLTSYLGHCASTRGWPFLRGSEMP